MRVFFVRHGAKKETNIINPKLNHTDPDLSELGESQARLLVKYFDEIKIDSIYVSEYKRNHQTAIPLSKKKGINVIEDKRLNEIDTGIVELMSEAEVERKYPQFWNDYNEKSRDYRYPEGETGGELIKRQNEVLKDLIIRNEHSVLISHDVFIRALMCNILGVPVYKRHLFKIEYGSITEIYYDNERKEWNVLRYNQKIS